MSVGGFSAAGDDSGERNAQYVVPDTELAVGSTLGSPRATAVLKATGAIERIWSVDLGEVVFGAVVPHHWDDATGVRLLPHSGRFIIYPERQEHRFRLGTEIEVCETVFVSSADPKDDSDPAAVFFALELTNRGAEPTSLSTYIFCEPRGETERDVLVRYDRSRRAFVARNAADRRAVRVASFSRQPASWHVTDDRGIAASARHPRNLPETNLTKPGDPLAVAHFTSRLQPGGRTSIALRITCALERNANARRLHGYREAATALARTSAYYGATLAKAVVATPDPEVNRGVLWAKADMLRVQLRAPTGWCFTNDPTRSRNSVGRDTAWYSFGSDYLTPWFSRESLRAYVRLQRRSGKVVEFYDVCSGRREDYGLNVNDDTPLLILALWHHYWATGDRAFLEQTYPAARRAADFLLSQRNRQGLVWCTARGTGERGIAGWRNVIQGERISGAPTELNSECYAALIRASEMAHEVGDAKRSERFGGEARRLRRAINRNLLDDRTGLYALTLDVDGTRRTEITADLVFPVMFGVADESVAAGIISRLSAEDFWTEAGIRTVPRVAPAYSPVLAHGLKGGVWVGMTLWFAFAAAKFSPDFMAHALRESFRHYSRNPRQNNTVPGQFSEWLHGETLVNEGMMLSPWFPPRYLWAAIEGACGLEQHGSGFQVRPRLAADWKWLCVQRLPFRDRELTWIAARVPGLRVYANFSGPSSEEHVNYAEDISACISARGEAVVAAGLRENSNLLLFAGNTSEHTTDVALRLRDVADGTYDVRSFNSLRGAWIDEPPVSAHDLRQGKTIQLERKGFCAVELARAS